jgi:hypothetical protein
MLGIGKSLKIGDAGSPGTVSEIANYCTNITATGTPTEVDATPYQPGVVSPVKVTEAGFDDLKFALTVKYNDDAWDRFSVLKGVNDLSYEYCPAGVTPGEAKITGVLNVLNVGLPQATPEGLLTFPVELRATTQLLGTVT